MADSINDELYNRIIDNSAMSRLFENKVITDVRRATKSHKEKLKAVVKTNPRSPEIRKEINRYIKQITVISEGHLTEYGAEQFSFHRNSLHKAVGDIYKVTAPKRNPMLTSIVGGNVPNDGSLDRQFAKIGDSEFKRADGIIKRGLAKGLSTPEISNKVAATVNISENQATALVRTAITRTTNLAQSEVMDANQGILKGYQFVAILDSRTSETCQYHDGRIYPIDDKRWLPPLHWRCRSTIIPLAKSFNEILETQDTKIRKTVVKTMSPTVRSKLDGRSIAKEGYGNWLRRQSYETKIRHFAGDVEKVGMFDRGLLELKQFFTPKGKSISIEALRRLDNFATTVFTQRRLIADAPDLPVKAQNPWHIIRNKNLEDDLRDFYVTEASSQTSPLGVVDYKGTSIAGKRQSKRAASNDMDNRTHFIDPVTGEMKNSYLYDPDFQVYQERIDFLRASKILSEKQKRHIEDFVTSLDEKMSVNQQSAVLENMRINYERYFDKSRPSYRQDWDNMDAIIRSEMNNSVVNVSRILDRRSRDRAQQFGMLGKATDEASIQIDGQWTTFNELAETMDSNQAFINNWRKEVGNSLARKAYYSGRAPLRFYFLDPVKNLTGLEKPSKALKRFIESQPGGKKLLAAIEGRPQPSLVDDFVNKLTQPYKRILQKDYSIRALLVDAREDFFSGKQNDNAIKTLSEAFELLASGTATDYDTLAINMGKIIYQKYPLNLTDKTPLLGNPSIQTYHLHGSKLLRMLEERNMIKVTPRGVTRRAVKDLDTNRPDGSWRDTLSREVLIMDKDLRTLQLTNRRLYVSKRIGVTRARDELVIDVDTKKYKTRIGRQTGDSIVTRKANVYYDSIQIDKDLVNEINWANATEWRVDQDYSDFMLDLVRFRDVRGNVKKYDDLNGVREIVLQRGDMGLGMMQTVKWHRDRGAPFKVVHQIDSRGRIYGRGYLTPTGGEFVRPFLNTAKAETLGVDGFLAFQEQVGSLLGPATEALTNAGRFAIFRRKGPELLELGRLIQSNTQRDRRIREVLEHPLMAALDPEEHPKLLRYALEYARIYDHINGFVPNKVTLKDGISGKILAAAKKDPNIGQFIDDPAKYKTIVVGGKEVGTISARNISANEVYIKSSFIDKPYRGKGYIQDAKELIIGNKAAVSDIEVSNSASRRAAEKMGFVTDGKVKIDPYDGAKILRYTRAARRPGEVNLNSTTALQRVASYKTQLPIEIDASASGAQIIALSTKNRALAFESNVIATPKKNRLYDIMAQDAISDPRFKALGRLPSDLTWEDLSKAAKAQNMVSFYGAGSATQTGNLADKFAKELLKRDYVVVTRRRSSNTPKEAFSQLELNKIIDNEIKDAKLIGADQTVADLTLLRKELTDVIENDAPIGSQLRAMARDVHPDVEKFVDRMSATHAGLVGPNEFKTISSIMSEHLARRAPVTEKFIAFWKVVAQDYMLETKNTDIPWVTFDGKIMRQRYRPVLEEHINWIDPQTGRRVKNVYRSTAEDSKLLGKGSIIGARTGLGVNGNHSNDAAIVRQFHLWGRDKGVPTATIHDAFFVNMGDAARAKTALRNIYADAAESDTLIATLKEMRKEGMSEKTYQKLLKKAREDGLIPPVGEELTREEILSPIPEGSAWYGIGP